MSSWTFDPGGAHARPAVSVLQSDGPVADEVPARGLSCVLFVSRGRFARTWRRRSAGRRTPTARDDGEKAEPGGRPGIVQKTHHWSTVPRKDRSGPVRRPGDVGPCRGAHRKRQNKKRRDGKKQSFLMFILLWFSVESSDHGHPSGCAVFERNERRGAYARPEDTCELIAGRMQNLRVEEAGGVQGRVLLYARQRKPPLCRTTCACPTRAREAGSRSPDTRVGGGTR